MRVRQSSGIDRCPSVLASVPLVVVVLTGPNCTSAGDAAFYDKTYEYDARTTIAGMDPGDGNCNWVSNPVTLYLRLGSDGTLSTVLLADFEHSCQDGVEITHERWDDYPVFCREVPYDWAAGEDGYGNLGLQSDTYDLVWGIVGSATYEYRVGLAERDDDRVLSLYVTEGDRDPEHWLAQETEDVDWEAQDCVSEEFDITDPDIYLPEIGTGTIEVETND